MEKHRTKCFFRFWAAFLMLLVMLVYQFTVYGAPMEETVRVGFFPMTGYHEYDDDGTPVGYDVDYLNMLKRYTNWQYEFVPMDSWDEALEALADGEIDLVGSAQLTTKRTMYFQYCAYASGATYAAMIAKKNDHHLVYEDFETFDNMRVGMTHTYIRHSEFIDYQQENDFSVHTVFFDTAQQMHQALQNGEIDAIVASATELAEDEKIIGKFAQASFYYITNRNNSKLMTQLNKASERLETELPGFRQQMEDKYFPHLSQTPLSKRELEYIQNSPVLIASSLDEYYPVSYYQNGRMEGIIPEMIRYIGNDSGLNFLLQPMPKGLRVTKYAATGGTDMVVSTPFTSANMQDSDIHITMPYFKTNVVFAGINGTVLVPTQNMRVAIPEARLSHIEYIKRQFPYFSILEYPDTAACLDAIKAGDADVTMQDAYVLEEYLRNSRYAALTILPTGSWEEEFSIALPSNTNPLLISILNKEIAGLPRETVNQIVLQHTMAQPYQITFWDILVQFQTPILTGIGILAALALFIWLVQYEKKKSLKLILKNQSTILHLANTINSGVLKLKKDEDYTIVYANHGFFSLLGMQKGVAEKEDLGKCTCYIHKDDLQEFRQKMSRKYSTGDTVELDIRLIGQGKRVVPVSFQGTFVSGAKGESRFYCVVVDISNQRKLIEELEIEKERYRILIEQSEDIMFDFDTETQMITCSAKFYEKFGWEIAKIRDNGEMIDLTGVHPNDREALEELKEKLRSQEGAGNCNLRMKKSNGEYIWCCLHVFIIRKAGRYPKLVGKLTDIDAQVRERQRLEQISKRDQLTRLLHKEAFQLAVEKRLEEQGESKHGALMFLDLDYFKTVNDHLGHLAGDIALRDTTAIIKENTSYEDIVSRFGGDEFCIFLENGHIDGVAQKADRICRNLRLQYQNAGKKVSISASIGIYILQSTDSSYKTILANADTALYEAKNKGRNTFVFYHDIVAN